MESTFRFTDVGTELETGLIRRCVDGELLAWRQLHREYYPIAQSFLRRMGLPVDELEDVCQEVFLQLFRSLGGFRGESSLKTFLYRVCLTHATRQRRRTRLVAQVRHLLALEPKSTCTCPGEVSEATLHERLEVGLSNLGVGHRAAFVLFEFDGLGGKAIAQILGCPEATVWRRLHEARDTVRRAIEGDCCGSQRS